MGGVCASNTGCCSQNEQKFNKTAYMCFCHNCEKYENNKSFLRTRPIVLYYTFA